MGLDRNDVLREAAALLTRRATASMDDIAKAAGISRATLHRHFAGRDALIRALEELGIERFEAAMDSARIEEGDAVEALRRLVAALRPVSGFLVFLYSESQLVEGEEVNAGWARLDARLAALFRRGQEQGNFRIDLTPVWLAEAVYGLMASAAWSVHDGRLAAKDMEYMVLELLLGGALRRSGDA
ncbi:MULTISPECIES: TetR/AcrR family transcriptional regulator [Streptomyces]|nr:MULTISPECIES: TetR/AcrR family transcriptional regulator [Streptomyces]AGO98685.1 TetR family transcriptional regulator [Streptomyces sp. LZ35]AGZ78445.1 putative TetR family transcriptional regulator [Streptomyces sp. RJA2928]ATL81503.1 TetR family transcriptional regulator [Streptomyces malaysiensis]AUA15136.1 Bacterial regulatory protein, tetR family [Streptomyces sp. M56]MCC4315948.1 TetR/AcrR family transcriptional regulator [Streptomyces malaysiensis]